MNARTFAIVGLCDHRAGHRRRAGAQVCVLREGRTRRLTPRRPRPHRLPPRTSTPTQASRRPPYEFEYKGLFAGVIISVMRHAGMDVELTIGVGEKSFEVLVAPMPWLDAKRAVFRPGERVEIRRMRGGTAGAVTRSWRARSTPLTRRSSCGISRDARSGTDWRTSRRNFPIIPQIHRCAWCDAGGPREHQDALTGDGLKPEFSTRLDDRGDSAPCCSQTRLMPAAAA